MNEEQIKILKEYLETNTAWNETLRDVCPEQAEYRRGVLVGLAIALNKLRALSTE